MITLGATNTIQGSAGTGAVITYTIMGDEKTAAGDSYKVLAQGQLATGAAALYTVPASTQTLVKTITLANTSASPVSSVMIYINGTAGSNLITSMPIPANGKAFFGPEGWKVTDANGALLTSAVLSLTGDVTGSGASPLPTTIANDAVTFAKLANIATDSLIGRDTAATGDPEAITLGASLEFSGSGTIQRAALSGGDVTAAANSNSLAIANDAVTYAKMQNIATDSLVGRDTAGTGDPEAITLGASLEFSGAGVIQRAAFAGGDVTASANSNILTIGNDTVTNAKLANMVANSIRGNNTGSTGDPLDLSIAQVTAMLDLATTTVKGLMSSADKVKLNGVWIDVVAQHGADNTGGADITSAVQAAITATPSAGGVIYFPPGTYLKSSATPISVDKPIIFMGAGRSISNINVSHATVDCFDVTTGGAGTGFEQLRISAPNSTTRTGGYAVDMNAIANVYMQQCDILYQHTGVHSGGALQFLDDLNIREGGAGASNGQFVLVDGLGDRYMRRLTTDNPSDPTGFAGVRVKRCSSLVLTDCNIINSGNALDLVPASTDVVASVLCTATFFDNCVIGANLLPAVNTATVHRVRFVNSWFGSNSTANVRMGDGTIPTANTASIDFIGCDFFGENGISPIGIDDNGSTDWTARGCRISGHSGNAIDVTVGTATGDHRFTITDNIIGYCLGTQVSSGVGNGGGISIGAGTYGSFQVTDNRGLEKNTTPGIVDNSTVAVPNEKIIKDNLGTGANSYNARNTATALINAATTLLDLPGMSFPIVAPNVKYAFQAMVPVNAASVTGSSGFQVGVNAPAGATIQVQAVGIASAATPKHSYFTAINAAQPGFMTSQTVAASTVAVQLMGVVVAGTATSHTGTVQIRAAMQQSSASSTPGSATVNLGGFLNANKVT